MYFINNFIKFNPSKNHVKLMRHTPQNSFSKLVLLNERTSSVLGSEKCRYSFQAQEHDDEVKGDGNSYDFGARIYDSRIGRFLTLDAHARDYPDISSFVFVNNMPLWAIDPDGNDIIILSAPSGANGMGHAAVLIGNDKNGWKLYSKNGVGEHTSSNSSGSKGASMNGDKGVYFKSLKDFANSEQNFHDGKQYYTKGFRISSSNEIDTKMKTAALKQVNKNYDLDQASCIDVASDALWEGGFNPGVLERSLSDTYTTLQLDMPEIPNSRYNVIKNKNAGVDISNSLKPDKAVSEAEKTVASPPKQESQKSNQQNVPKALVRDNTNLVLPNTTVDFEKVNNATKVLNNARGKKD